MLHGLARVHAERIEAARGDRPFRSLEDFSQRTRLNRPVLSRLAKAGAFGSLRINRREALWHALAQDQKELPLFDHKLSSNPSRAVRSDRIDAVHLDNLGSGPDESGHYKPAAVPLPAMSAAQEVLADYQTIGLSLRAHPLEFLRQGLDRMDIVSAERLENWPDGKPVSVAGIVLVRQRPGTAKGITFVTLEDETGTANLIIRQNVWKRYRQAALGATLMLAHGRLQRQGQVIHVLCTKLEDLSQRVRELGPQSRDFC
jgi:error-prone DNA polymerase